MALAPAILATLALLTVAGAVGRDLNEPEPSPALEAQLRLERLVEMGVSGTPLEEAQGRVRAFDAANFTFESVLADGIGGTAGAVMLLVFGLTSMAAAVYAAFIFGHRFAELSPRLPRWAWGVLGALSAYPLLATGLAAEAPALFGILGAAFAPVAGAIAADFILHRGTWPGPRPGVRVAGLIAWAVGFAVGLLPTIGRLAGVEILTHAQPASLLAFAAGFVVFALLSPFGARRGEEDLSQRRGAAEKDGTAER